MNNMAGMPTMNAMGGPVGPPMNMMNNGALAPPQSAPPTQLQLNDSGRTLLNTYIYEYFVRYNMFSCARAVYEADPQIKVMKDSPGKGRDENGNLLGNGLGSDAMDTDAKDGLDQKRPDDLPAPNVPTPVPDSCFLYEWFCLFWDMFNSQKGKGSSGQVNQYVQYTQQQSRMRQEQQRDMLRQMRPEFAPQQFHPQMMRGMPNGAMNMGMKPGNQLQRAAMANSQNPQAMQLLHQQKAAGQMQRDPSDMDGSRARPADSGEGDNAPSPTKRPRLDGGAPFNPNQAVMMPNGRPGQVMPGQQQLQAFASATPGLQAKTLATYSTNMSQHHGNQMPNKPMPAAAGPQGQGSPMVPPGPDGNSLNQYYNPELGPGNVRPGAPNGQATAGSNLALQDYQMQLMLLEQQNKKRLMMARQEQEVSTGNMPRVEGPGGPGGPGGAAGPNGQAFQGTSPPGARSGASPNPAEQMKRANQQMANAANMGSPLPDGAAQSRSSPGSMNFMGANMDPNAGPHFGMNMNMAQMNGAMRPPGSHPPFNGQMNAQQMLAAQRQAQQPGAQGGPMQWSQGGPNGQMAGQPPQPQVPGGPAQNQRSMPPPSAPAAAAAAANAANARNTTASPQVSNAAPPTPQPATKAAPKKKETKSAKAKAAAQKKSNPNLNNAGATPAPEPAEAPQEAPAAPATPITPVNPANFAKNQSVNGPQGVPNGQNAAAAAPPQLAPVPPQSSHADPNQSNNFLDTGALDFQLDFAPNPLQTDNVLSDFDFESFLHDGPGAEDTNFDFGTGAFSMEPDTTIGTTD